MFDNASSNENYNKAQDFRYSQNSINSSKNSDLDYNLYCFSQGYANKEKGFWKGVLRNKNVDFALRFNKEWNYKFELEDEISLSETQSQQSSLETDIISYVNETEIGWDKNLFQNFKKQQTGTKKLKNKEWLLSNGVKRSQVGVELRTQNYKQFQENEKNKNIMKEKVKKYQNKQELILNKSQFSNKTKDKELNKFNITQKNYQKSNVGSDVKEAGSSTYNIYSKIDSQKYGKESKRKDTYISDKKPYLYRNYSTYQKGNKFFGEKRQEISIGQNYNKNLNKGNEVYVEAFKLKDVAPNLGKLEVSAERKKKEKIERKPESRKHERVYSSKKKRKVSLDKYGKPITNTSRLNVDTSKKKAQKERLENRTRLEVSQERKKKEIIQKKPEPRKHSRYHSSKKKKVSLDKNGKPLTNTSRLNVDTSKKKAQKERLENRAKLEVSAERKKKEIIQRKPEPRKHSRYHSSKKKKLSVDKDGKPLPNTSRLNVDTSKKKVQKDRLENRSRLEVSVGKKKEIIQRKPESRKHSRYHSSKKKKVSLDKYGKPLTNTSRLNVDTSKKKTQKERLENTSRLEVSAEKKKKERIEKKTEPRKHSRVHSNKKKKISLDKDGKPITNVNRLRIGVEMGRVKYAQIEDFDKYEDKSHPRHERFSITTSNINIYHKPANDNTSIYTPVKKQEHNGQKVFHQRQNGLQGQIQKQKVTEAGKAFFTNRYQRIKKEDVIQAISYTDYKTNKNQQSQKTLGKDYSYSNIKYDLSTSKLNTNDTNSAYKHNRIDKDFNIPKSALFGKQGQNQNELNRNYSYNKDLIIKKNYNIIKEKEKKTSEAKETKVLSEIKKLDFSKYYVTKKTDKKKLVQAIYQKPVDKINGKDIYEYNPLSQSNTYTNIPKITAENKNQKEYSINIGKYNTISNKLNTKQKLTSEVSQETIFSENKKEGLNASYRSKTPSNMAYFKLQFLTTKQVVDKFWESIDNGELPISMFDPQKNSSKLSNYISPEKNRYSVISSSNEDTEISSKYRNFRGINNKKNNPNIEVDIGRTRRSYKA